MKNKSSLALLAALGFLSFQAVADQTQEAPKPAIQPAGAVTASEPAPASAVSVPKTHAPAETIKWTPFEFGLWFDVPGYTKRVGVNGFRLGFPFSGTSPVRGLDLSLLGSDVSSIDGAQISVGFCNSSKSSYGLQAAVGACINNENIDGVQVSLLNKGKLNRGWQIGGGNLSDNVIGSQLGIVNVTEQSKGGQVSLITNVAEQNDGFQVSLVNVLKRNIGPQIGLVNVADRSNFQIGLINVNLDSPIPFMIIFNFSN